MAYWYVMPRHASYNNGDGTDPDPASTPGGVGAWRGMNAVIWGTGGVEAGDTLWVLDDWSDDPATSTSGSGGVALNVGASGESGSPITIRGDYPGRPATWGYYFFRYPAGTSYSLVQTGVYSLVSTRTSWLQQDQLLGKIATDSLTQPPTSGELSAMPEGFYYRDSVGGLVYFKLANGDSPTLYSMTVGGIGEVIVVNTHDYIDIKNLTLAAGGIGILSSNHINIDNVNVAWGDFGVKIYTSGGSRSTNISITNCTFDHFADGIYSIYGCSENLTIENCTITNCRPFGDGVDPPYSSPYAIADSNDYHAIGLMAGHEQYVTGCTMRDCATAVTLYSGWTDSDPHVEINRCWAENMWRNESCTTNGILDCHGAAYDLHVSGSVAVGDITFNVYNSAAINCDNAGIRSLPNCGANVPGTIYNPSGIGTYQFFNNTIVNCQVGIAVGGSSAVGSGGSTHYLRNNVIYEPTDRSNGLTCAFIHWRNTDPISADHNLYYSTAAGWPSTAELFFQRTGYLSGNTWTLAEWQASTYTPDTDAATSDPLFTDAANDDFTLTADSPCIDAGMNTGILVDYLGNTRPYNNIYDIGAYEYIGSVHTTFPSYPISDISTGTWLSTGSLYYTEVDESDPIDTDYVYTRSSGDTIEFKLSALVNPETFNYHRLKFRIQGPTYIYLVKDSGIGETIIAQWYKNPSVPITYNEFLTLTQAENINNDYTNLSVRFISG